ncbi:aminotransferase class I/II-fold pyridoxal phosphate-dependent enzyme [Hymenobacter sp. BT188]|uniref:pyridoxal phosphate-dependent aminotransferase n=1 Tax=Hymenobacter sp. BT188 TaxID=2763504 RepID=UPI0016517CF4|nr:aminotransferase class I/II-fold pyridoxal phosphate-dependent enzyme [Hymenobacter sp. BT188]MBC6605313.1 aminotransferase class I/II-fold pyridoxal phosphate-dependent enzyme [Hymenobacter sp. BT188]
MAALLPDSLPPTPLAAADFPTVINLASGYGNFATPAVAAEKAIAAIQADRLLPGPVEGLLALREAIADNYHRQKAPQITPAHIMVTPGVKAALFALLKTILRPGDEVLVPTPNWFGFGELITQAGGTMRALPLDSADGYALQPEVLESTITPRTRVFLFSNPNNPTGRIYGHDEVEALLTVTRRYPDMFVLSDEIYNLINFSSAPVPCLLAFPDPHGQHLVVNGFSKSLALIGWGVGYLVAPLALVQAAAGEQFATGAAVPVPNQHAALAATEHSAAIAQELLVQLAPTRALLLAALAAMPGVCFVEPEGTYYVFADFRHFLPAARSSTEASAALVAQLRAGGVDVVDGATCGAPGFARISYALPEPELREALLRLQSVLLR